MTLTEATEKVNKMAADNEGKFGSKANFMFDEGVIHLDDTVAPILVSNDDLVADCSLKMSLESFEKMLEGSLNPMMAFMSGKMKVDGDKGVAMKLSSLF